MVKYIILMETKSPNVHSIMRLGIFKHDAFIQEINHWADGKRTQTTFPLGLEALQKIKEAI